MGSRYSSANKVFSYNKTSNKPIKKLTALHISQGTGKGGGVKGGGEKGGRGEKGRREEKGRGEEVRRGGEEATGRSSESLQHESLDKLVLSFKSSS